MSRQELAEAVNAWQWENRQVEDHLDERDIGKIETGRTRWPGKFRREGFRAVLEAKTDPELGFYPNRRPRVRPSAQEPPALDDGQRAEAGFWIGHGQSTTLPDVIPLIQRSVANAAGSRLQGDPAKGVGTGAAGAIADALNIPSLGISPFDGMTLQQSGEHLLKVFLHLDDELGGDSLFLPLSRYVARMAVSVREEPSDGLLVFGQLNQMAGWLALDANMYVVANRYFETAVQIGREADDPGLAASALAYMSLQEMYQGQLAHALSLAQQAVALNSRQLTPLIRTMLGTRLARVYAALGSRGDRRENSALCLKALRAARNGFDQVGSMEEPHYVSYVDSIELTAQEGACFLDLGMSKRAETSLTSAIGLLSIHAPNRVRDRVHYLSRLAKCYLLDKKVEQACETGQHALDLSRMIGSARVAERLGEFEASLAPYVGVPCANEFRERYRASVSHKGSGLGS